MIVAEPFPFIMSAQMGVMWLELAVSGRPAHVLDTSAGFNAVEAVFTLYQALKVVEESWNDPSVRPEIYKDLKVSYDTTSLTSPLFLSLVFTFTST